ncbi:MAG: hypothetical protein AB8B56_12615 [Crocinitomicaceae bacterium]
MNNLTKILFQAFSEDPQFEIYFWEIDPDQDGNYATFGVYGEVLKSLLIGKITDDEFLGKLCSFLNQVIFQGNPEWTNVLRSEVFSILDKAELIKLDSILSEDARKIVAEYLQPQ